MSNTGRAARVALLAVTFAALVYAVFFSSLSLTRHQALLTHTADLGQIDLAVWNTSFGRFVQEIKGDQISTRLTDHFEPVFWPLSVVFGLRDNAGALLIAQAVALASASLLVLAAVAWPGRGSTPGSRLGVAAGTWAALAYLLAPQAQAATVADFHASPMAVVPLALLLLAGGRGLTGATLVAALAALSVKEEIALVVAVAGLYLAVARGRRVGWVIALLAMAWFALATFVIIPHYSGDYYGNAQSPYLSRYDLGTTTADGAMSPLGTRILATLGSILALPKLRYLAGLLLAFAGMPLLAPEVAVIAAPLIAANVLSGYDAMYSGEFHYSAPFMSVWAIAAGVGARRWLGRTWGPGWARRLAVLLPLAVLPLGYQILDGFTPIGAEYPLHRPKVTEHARLLSRFTGQIPSNASLSTTPALHPHFSHRQLIYTYPDLGDAEYVLLDVSGTTDMHPADLERSLTEMRQEGYGVLDSADGYVLLRRSAPDLGLDLEFYRFVHPAGTPQHSLDLPFGASLRLWGYDWLDDPKWGQTSLRLYWEALAPLGDDLDPYVVFVDQYGGRIADTRSLPMLEAVWYPTTDWQPGARVITTTAPAPLGPVFGAYVAVVVQENYDDVSARLPVSGTGAEIISELNLVQLPLVERRDQPFDHRLVPAATTIPKEALRPDPVRFRSSLQLLGAAGSSTSVTPGGMLLVRSYWRRLGESVGPVALSVRLRSPGNDDRSQMDGPLHGGLYPPDSWPVGQVVADAKALPIPVDCPPGRYEIVLMVYDRTTLAPLPTSSGGTDVVVGEVHVTEWAGE